MEEGTRIETFKNSDGTYRAIVIDTAIDVPSETVYMEMHYDPVTGIFTVLEFGRIISA